MRIELDNGVFLYFGASIGSRPLALAIKENFKILHLDIILHFGVRGLYKIHWITFLRASYLMGKLWRDSGHSILVIGSWLRLKFAKEPEYIYVFNPHLRRSLLVNIIFYFRIEDGKIVKLLVMEINIGAPIVGFNMMYLNGYNII